MSAKELPMLTKLKNWSINKPVSVIIDDIFSIFNIVNYNDTNESFNEFRRIFKFYITIFKKRKLYFIPVHDIIMQ